jgi:hypothetical protein
LRVEPAKLWLVIQIVESTGLGVDLRSGPVREPESVAVDNVFSTAPGEEFALPAVLPYAYYPERDEFPYHMIQWVVDLDYVRRAELDRLQSLPEDPENPVDPESMRFVMAFTAAHGYFNPDPEHQYPPLTISATVIAGGAVVPGGVPETEYREAGPPFVVTGGVVRAATQVAVPSNNTGTTGLVRVEYDLIGAPEMIVLVEED